MEKEGIPLVCIGYKYNKGKILLLVMSKGAGSTVAGNPYHAKFPDRYGNVCVRYVERPKCLATYFERSNVIDVWNQLRQFDLAMEKSGLSSVDILGC